MSPPDCALVDGGRDARAGKAERLRELAASAEAATTMPLHCPAITGLALREVADDIDRGEPAIIRGVDLPWLRDIRRDEARYTSHPTEGRHYRAMVEILDEAIALLEAA